MKTIWLGVLVCVAMLLGGPVAAGAEGDGGPRAKAFWAAAAKGDAEAMKDFYAEKVLVLAGSELLKPEWGLPGGGRRDENLLVARDDLAAGYGRMFARIGRQRWADVFTAIPADKLRVEPLDMKNPPPGLSRDAIGLTVFTGPGDDRLLFILDKNPDGRWHVVAEAADY